MPSPNLVSYLVSWNVNVVGEIKRDSAASGKVCPITAFYSTQQPYADHQSRFEQNMAVWNRSSHITHLDYVVLSQRFLSCSFPGFLHHPIPSNGPCFVLAPRSKWDQKNFVTSHCYAFVEQMQLSLASHSHQCLHESLNPAASDHFIMWRAAYSHFLEHPENFDLVLHCSVSDIPHVRRACAVTLAKATLSKPYSAVLRETLKQGGYSLAERAVMDALLPTDVGSMTFLWVEDKEHWYSSWPYDVRVTFQTFRTQYIRLVALRWTFIKNRSITREQWDTLLCASRLSSFSSGIAQAVENNLQP